MDIIKVRFKSGAEFHQHYNEELPHGGLFCPTTTEYKNLTPVVVDLKLPELPNKLMLRGQVVWWRSPLPRLGVRAGALVAFDESESPKHDFLVERLAGGREGVKRRRHTRLPIELPVRWRRKLEPDFREAGISEVSIGGAQLFTPDKPQDGDDLVIQLTPPGGSAPMDIAARVTYQLEDGCGVRFIFRDGGGSRRLREVIRRIKQHG